MSSAERLAHKAIVGNVDEIVNDFLKNAPTGSELIIIGNNTAEMVTIVEFPKLKEVALKTTDHIKHELNQARKVLSNTTVLRGHPTSSPAGQTSQ